MSFSNIPDETVHRIFQNFRSLSNREFDYGLGYPGDTIYTRVPRDHVSGAGDLCRLMLVCRRFRDIAEPILYREFDCGISSDGFSNFTRTIITRPDLACHVRRVVRSVSEPEAMETPVFNDARENIKTTANKYPWELRSDIFWEDLKGGRWDPWLAILIPLLPRLKKLELCEVSGDYDTEKHLLWVIGQIAKSQQHSDVTKHRCPDLEEITLVYLDTKMGLGLDFVLDICRPRSVKKLNVGPVDTEEWEPRERDTKLALKDITIHNSAIDSKSISNMLGFCPELERFSYQAGDATIGFAQFEPSSIAPGLMTLKKTLQYLKIEDYDVLYHNENDGINHLSAIGSLVSFTQLKVIDVMSWMLISKNHYVGDTPPKRGLRLVDVLPKSLESLRMVWCGQTIFQHVAELMEKGKEKVPLLKDICLVVQKLGGGLLKGIDKETVEELVMGCEAHGVNLKVTY